MVAEASPAREFFKDDAFDFNLKLALGSAYYRCADVGECLATASRIKDGDIDSWFDEWIATADRVRQIAEDAERKGHSISARDAYLRASNYYGTAFFFVLGTKDTSRSLATWRIHRACFDKALDRWPTPVEKIAIPYEKTTLKGYLLSPDKRGIRRPLAILNN